MSEVDSVHGAIHHQPLFPQLVSKDAALIISNNNSPRDVNYYPSVKIPNTTRPSRENILQRLSEALLRRCLTKVGIVLQSA
jgi:hypothetical protein